MTLTTSLLHLNLFVHYTYLFVCYIYNLVVCYIYNHFVPDMDARPWDFQAEECALRACVDRFNNRRYGNNGTDPDFKPVDNCLLSVLGENVELSEEFKNNYERWLDQEVFGRKVDWDLMLDRC